MVEDVLHIYKDLDSIPRILLPSPARNLDFDMTVLHYTMQVHTHRECPNGDEAKL